MSDHNAPSLSTLVQRFFLEHLGQHRAVSRQTVAVYRDTLRLLLSFAARRLHLGNIDMEVADRVALEFLPGHLVAFDVRQAGDAIPLKATMQG